MKVDIISDIHFEKNEISSLLSILPLQSKYLIIAGDVTRIETHWTKLKKFIKLVVEAYEKVFYVLGNHELYVKDSDISVNELMRKVRKLKIKYSNLHILEQEIVDLDDEKVVIYGSILFSKLKASRCPEVPIYPHPGRKITEKQWNKCHEAIVDNLERAIRYAKAKGYELIVITHYAPLYNEALDPKYHNHANNDLYCTDLSRYFSYVRSWVFGHTGYNCDVTIDGCRILSNQYSTKTGPAYVKESFVI